MPRATSQYNLHLTRPALVREWHPTKNDDLSPCEITHGSGKKIWWLCKEGHTWHARVYSRSRGSGCPVCRKHKKSDNEYLLISIPSLLQQWHPSKNIGLNPRFITTTDKREIWWLCNSSHEWPDTIKNRLKGQGCPICDKNSIKPIPMVFEDLYEQHYSESIDNTPEENAAEVYSLDYSEIYNGIEFRKYKCFPQVAPGFLIEPGYGHWIYAEMINFSDGGMYFKTEVPFNPGKPVNIKFKRPLFHSAPSVFKSIVSWCGELADENETMFTYGLGVKFI